MRDLAGNWDRFFLEITNRCNFECIFCPSGVSKRRRGDMPTDLALGLIDALQELGFGGAILFHVLGEPLLHPAVFEIVDHAAHAEMRPVLFTNGGALTREMTEGILTSRCGELVISMQTINRGSYEMLRKTPFGWDAYLGRIQRALAIANDPGKNRNGCAFRVSIGVKKPDPEHPQDLYFLEYQSPQQIRQCVAEVFSKVKGTDIATALSQCEAEGLLSAPSVKVGRFLSLSVKPMSNWRRMWREERAASGQCPFFGKELAVLSNGAVTFCHVDYDGRTRVGSVKESSLGEIIGAPGFRRTVTEFVSGARVAKGCEYCNGVNS